MADVQIALADVSELKGAGIDVLTRDVIAAKSASNDPADIAESKAKAEEKAKPKEAEKPKPDAKDQRIGELTRKRADAERETAKERDARLKAEARIAELEEAAKKQPKPEAPRPKRPKREDFDDLSGYEEALDRYDDELHDWRQAKGAAKPAEDDGKKAKDDEDKRRKQDAEKRAQADAEEIGKRFAQQQDKAREQHADYDEVIGQDITLKPSLVAAVLTSDTGAEMLYHFGKNPELVDELNGMEQAAMLKKLGKIELSLEPKQEAADGAADRPRAADGTFVSKDVSAAKEPIDPVKGGDATASGEKDPDRMSVAEHREAAFRSSKGR